jgi:hypothetical protein
MPPKKKATAKPTKDKGIKYAKYAKPGDFVHIKAVNVSNNSQLKRWYGLQASDRWITGVLDEIITTTENNRKVTYSTVITTCQLVLPSLQGRRIYCIIQGCGRIQIHPRGFPSWVLGKLEPARQPFKLRLQPQIAPTAPLLSSTCIFNRRLAC